MTDVASDEATAYVKPLHFKVIGSPDHVLDTDATERAYAAGFFDGEGTVTIAQGKRADCQWPILNMRVIVGQNEIEPLLWLRARWSGTIVGRAAGNGRKQHHTWTCFSRQAEKFLADVSPYLQVKRERADLALRFQQSMGKPGSNVGLEKRSFYLSCRPEMLRLNGYKRRGSR